MFTCCEFKKGGHLEGEMHARSDANGPVQPNNHDISDFAIPNSKLEE